MSNKTIDCLLLSAVQNAIGKKQMTVEEASEWMMNKIDEYEEGKDAIEPFYDANYELSMSISIN